MEPVHDSEESIKLVKGESQEDSDKVKRTRSILESYEAKSDLKTGDVVTFRSGLPIGKYAVSSVIKATHGEDLYQYELIPIINNASFSESCICGRLMLEFQYHDKKWAEYFTESVGNGLPPWRGNLYNVYALYLDPETHEYGELDDLLIKNYNNDTIPPVYMEHILRSHSVYDRMTDVFKSTTNMDIIANNLNIPVSSLARLRKEVRRKINARNTTDMEPEYQADISNQAFPTFTRQELRFIAEIDKLDISKGQFKDHFPVEMTNLQIMKAIRESYHNAKKCGHRKMEKNHDRRNGEITEPVKGKILYEGITHDNMIIQFWYNFDLGIIETAYPTEMNDNAKKH